VVVFYLKRWGGVIGGHNTSMMFGSWKVVGLGFCVPLGGLKQLELVAGTLRLP